MKLNYNKAYYFRYKAIGEGKIHVYDKTPLIFILDIRSNSILGLNMHWVPRQNRAELYENIMEIMQKTDSHAKRKTRQRLTYQLLRQPKFQAGMQGIRMYYMEGMTQLKELEPERLSILLGRYGKYFEFRMRRVYKRSGYKD